MTVGENDKNFAEPVAEPKIKRITISLWDDNLAALAIVSIEADERGTFPVANWSPAVTRWRVERIEHR